MGEVGEFVSDSSRMCVCGVRMEVCQGSEVLCRDFSTSPSLLLFMSLHFRTFSQNN